jgi:hypothetical protein
MSSIVRINNSKVSHRKSVPPFIDFLASGMISMIHKACSVPWFPNKPWIMQYCSKLSLPSYHSMNPGCRVDIKGLGHVYHAACVRDLIGVLYEVHSEIQKDYLAATCLPRSYEVLNGKLINSCLKGSDSCR